MRALSDCDKGSKFCDNEDLVAALTLRRDRGLAPKQVVTGWDDGRRRKPYYLDGDNG